MRFSLFIIFILSFNYIKAQFKYSVSTLSGYEYNINRYPNSFINDNDVLLTENDLYLNSFYQDLNASAEYRKKWKDHRITFNISPEIRYFYSEPSYRVLIFNSSFEHTYNFTRRTKLQSRIRFKNKDRKGNDFEEAELSLPLGYNQTDVQSRLYFDIHKNNRTFIRLNYAFKNFDDSITRSAQYNKYGIDMRYQNEINQTKYHYYGFDIGYYSRYYDLYSFSTNSSRKRNWQYVDFSVFYSLPLSETFRTRLSLNYEKRIDVTDNKFSYSQIKPSVNFKYKKDKISAGLSYYYYIRDFKTFQADSTTEKDIDNLNYVYQRIVANLNYQLNDNLDFIVDGYLLDRESNNTNLNTQAYRDYINYYMGAGLQYNF